MLQAGGTGSTSSTAVLTAFLPTEHTQFVHQHQLRRCMLSVPKRHAYGGRNEKEPPFSVADDLGVANTQNTLRLLRYHVCEITKTSKSEVQSRLTFMVASRPRLMPNRQECRLMTGPVLGSCSPDHALHSSNLRPAGGCFAPEGGERGRSRIERPCPPGASPPSRSSLGGRKESLCRAFCVERHRLAPSRTDVTRAQAVNRDQDSKIF